MNWLNRQGFLGVGSDRKLAETTIGIVGLGGGGSHCAQQFAHAGIGRYVLIDPDTIEEHNLNRLIGGSVRFVKQRLAKVEIARCQILGIQPTAEVISIKGLWQCSLNDLRRCDIVVGCVDSFRARDELERFCRQNLIPYIDIGMDVTEVGSDHLVAGQVLLSSPGEPCLRCVGVVTDERLTREAEQYGSAGPRPQVVWPNGVLASLAVGLAMQLLTPWHKGAIASAYREYDANTHTVRESPKWATLQQRNCSHHPSRDRGDPTFDIRCWSPTTPSSVKPPSMGTIVLDKLREIFS